MQDYKYDLALSNYRSLTGDYDTQFESVEDIYVAIQNAVDNDGDATIIRPLNTDITENGTYEFKKQDNIDAYEPVAINVNIDTETFYNQGYNVGYEEGESNQKSKLEDIDITSNGTYSKDDGYKTVNVNIDSSIFFNEGFEAGKTEGYNLGFGEGESNQKSKLEDIEITSNGTYSKEDGYKSVNVNVDGSIFYNEGFEAGESNQKSKLEDIEITSNGTYSKEDGYKNVTVKVSSEGLDFSIIGYDSELSKELNGDFQADIDYSKSLYDKYNGVLSGSASDLFENDVNLIYCPKFDTSGVTVMVDMFRRCTNLQTIPQLNTSNVKSMNATFWDCTNLQTIPLLDTGNVINMSYMFSGCTNLQTIPLLDTGNVTNMSSMFKGCTNLQTIPQLNTSNVTDTNSMFYGCQNLQSIPLLDTGNATIITSMFYNCYNIESIPQLNTSNVTGMSSIFWSCDNLKSIPLLDAGNVTSASYAIYGCDLLTDVGGFKDLGKQKSLSTSSMFSSTNNLTHDSIMNIINNLYDRAAAGYSTVTLPLGTQNLSRISADEKAIATNKGWTLS